VPKGGIAMAKKPAKHFRKTKKINILYICGSVVFIEREISNKQYFAEAKIEN